jgi:hypothetical protein
MAEPEPEAVREAGSLSLLELRRWRDEYGVVAGITLLGDPPGADFGLAGTAPVGGVLDRWRTLLAAHPGFDSVVVSSQVHGVAIGWHTEGTGLRVLDRLDGHGTSTPGVLLAVTAADCVPVYLVDPVGGRVALLHAGWRGTAAGILAEGLTLMGRHGSRVADVVMHCGVGICGECYEVGPEVMEACGTPPADRTAKGHVDLRAVLSSQARRLGIGSVTVSGHCSSHDPGRFHSHRASRGSAGRMAAVLGILPPGRD